MRRFFDSASFWNRPIGPAPEIDPESFRFVEFMVQFDIRRFWLNLVEWTVPIYAASGPKGDGYICGDLIKFQMPHYRVMKIEKVIAKKWGAERLPKGGIAPDLSYDSVDSAPIPCL